MGVVQRSRSMQVAIFRPHCFVRSPETSVSPLKNSSRPEVWPNQPLRPTSSWGQPPQFMQKEASLAAERYGESSWRIQLSAPARGGHPAPILRAPHWTKHGLISARLL
jgi:hypothetical protein